LAWRIDMKWIPPAHLLLMLGSLIAACDDRAVRPVAIDAAPDDSGDVAPAANDAADGSPAAPDAPGAEAPPPLVSACAPAGFGDISPVDCAHCGQPPPGQFVCPLNLDECGLDLVDRGGCSLFGICSHCLACRPSGNGWEWSHASANCQCGPGSTRLPDGGMDCRIPDAFTCRGAFISNEDCARCGDAPKTPPSEPFLACPPDPATCTLTPGRCRAACDWGYCWKCDGNGWRKTTVTCPMR
jgi:hypothetical protein